MVEKIKNFTNQNSEEPKANAWALLPVGVFLLIFISGQIVVSTIPSLKVYFGGTPIAPAFIVALIFALCQNRKIKFEEKLGIAGQGIGNSSIIYMIIIFILAGIFAGTVGRSSAASVAYFMLNFIPAQFSVVVLFIVACVVSLAMGTSCGSVTLITPIAVSVSFITDQNPAICVASVLCGSMFGDNLSMISDTAIAACTGLGCKPIEKFKENTKICLPAALITVVILLCTTMAAGNGNAVHEPYDLIDFIPYLLVFILSVFGINVLLVLTTGIISGVFIMLLVHGYEFHEVFNSMTTGVGGMYEIIFITILVASIASLIKANGGFAFALNIIKNNCRNKKVAQIVTGFMVGLIDVVTANNTVALVVSCPIAKDICQMYGIRRRRMASVTDTCSCIAQGLLPYGAQMLIAISLCNESGCLLTAVDIIPYCLYQFILFVVVIFFIVTGLSDKKASWFKKS